MHYYSYRNRRFWYRSTAKRDTGSAFRVATGGKHPRADPGIKDLHTILNVPLSIVAPHTLFRRIESAQEHCNIKYHEARRNKKSQGRCAKEDGNLDLP
jgi:hypothetical protein